MDLKEQLISSLASHESEQAVIGGLLMRNDAIDECVHLKPTMFHNRMHGLIYKAIASLLAEGKPADAVTTAERLDLLGHEGEYGGIAYLAEIVQHTPSAAHIRRYIEIVQTRNAERQMFLASDIIAELATERDGRSLADRQAEAMRLLETISDGATEGARESTAAEALFAGIKAIDERMSRPEGELGGLPTGLRALDELLDGLHPADLIVIGARPSMGKSVLGEMIARTNAKRGAGVRIQSYEMPAKDIMLRSAAAEMGIHLQNIRFARMTQDEYMKFSAFCGMSKDWNLVIDNDGCNFDKIAARARAQKRRTGLDLLLVDHLHVMPIAGKNVVREIADITGGFKRLAMELNIPIVLLAQLTKAAGQGPIRAPRLPDLRESGAIEQDADIVIFPHRPGYYDNELNEAEAELHVAKHRNGPTGQIICGWHGAFVRYQDQIPTDWTPKKAHYAGAPDEL